MASLFRDGTVGWNVGSLFFLFGVCRLRHFLFLPHPSVVFLFFLWDEVPSWCKLYDCPQACALLLDSSCPLNEFLPVLPDNLNTTPPDIIPRHTGEAQLWTELLHLFTQPHSSSMCLVPCMNCISLQAQLCPQGPILKTEHEDLTFALSGSKAHSCCWWIIWTEWVPECIYLSVSLGRQHALCGLTRLERIGFSLGWVYSLPLNNDSRKANVVPRNLDRHHRFDS